MNNHLSVEQMNELSIHIMDIVQATPIHDIIYTNDDGQLIVNGKPVEMEKMVQLREHARIALDNKALELIRKQVAFTAIANGIHKAETPEQMIFNRAAIWYHQMLENHLKLLAQREDLG